MAEAGDDNFEFLSDPVGSGGRCDSAPNLVLFPLLWVMFSLPDLGGGESILDAEGTRTLVCTTAHSSIGDVGNAAVTVQLDLYSSCEGLSLSAPNSEQSTGKNNPQVPGWTKRVLVGHAPLEGTPCAGKISGLEKTLRSYAEKKTDTLLIPAV
ncbi:hypothetical protein VPH35_091758 [Triticum aestivum]